MRLKPHRRPRARRVVDRGLGPGTGADRRLRCRPRPLKNAAIAALKEQILDVLNEQGRKFRRMARRLSVHTNLDKYALPDPPRWRTHDWETGIFQYASDYVAALNYGDASGGAYEGVARSREAVGGATRPSAAGRA